MDGLAPFVLVEAVPNLSFGPGEQGLEAALEALACEASPAWALLDVHSDVDHRRSVLTLAGAPAAVMRALRAMAHAAIEHGDIARHAGAHPRLGIVDVVPLVALVDAPQRVVERAGSDMAAWLAHHGVPVHLYGALARNDERRALPNIRAMRRSNEADGRPDLVPSKVLAAAGESCVGVRPPLVAYNVLLDSTDLEQGRAIARVVRESNGGLAGIQAMAVQLRSQRDRVQVSMNLVQPFTTTPSRAFAAVRGAAEARGLRVLGAELVGLAPDLSLPSDPAEAGLAARPPSLEHRLRERGLVAQMEMFRTS